MFICTSWFSQSQESNTRSKYKYQLSRSKSAIEIDGVIDDAWNSVDAISKFNNHFPDDKGEPFKETKVKLYFDDSYLYVLAICYDEGKRVIQTRQIDNRDGHWDSDSFTITLDPQNTKQNGFMFGLNAGGAMIESSLFVESDRTINSETWDNKWLGKVKHYDKYWVAEMAIPFSSLRFKKDNKTWGVNFIRRDVDKNFYYTWTWFPLNFGGVDLNYMGSLIWPENIPKSGRFYSLIPYTAFSSIRNFENNSELKAVNDFNYGIDAKVSITKSMNLDVTVNPDFSNADVDQQIVNLTRFSIFLPEQRNFFLENNDIFSNFGGWGVQPFFSRRIGLDAGEVVPVNYGARITGNVSEKTRVGLMHIQTDGTNDDISSQKFTVGAIHQQVLDRSIIKAIVIDKKEEGNLQDSYARNLGIEFTYLSKEGRFNNTIRFHTSHTDENLDNNIYYGFNGNYNTRSFRSGWTFDVVGTNYINEVGINPRLENFNAETEEVIRVGYIHFNPYMRYLFFPKNNISRLNWHGIRTWHKLTLNRDGSLNETENNLAYDFSYKNSSRLNFITQYRHVNLLFPTSFLGDFDPLPSSSYTFFNGGIFYRSDIRKQVNWDSTINYGSFFKGTRLNFELNSTIRFQPWGRFSLSYNYNNVKLPDNFGERELHLLRFNGNISFSNNIFLSSTTQFNTQNKTFGIFSRLQWRFLPMSDLFVIYSHNYDTDGFTSRNRGLSVKAAYWF